MILNCLKCGKAISSRLNLCPYCKTDLTIFAYEMEETKKQSKNRQYVLKDEYKGTLASYILK